MREKLISFGDDYWIETTEGKRAFFVDGSAFRVRDNLKIKDPQGNVLCEIQEQLLRIQKTMTIERQGLGTITVKKSVVRILRDRFEASMPGGDTIEIQGNIVSHEYMMERGGRKVGEVSKKWIQLSDSYTVEVAPGEDAVTILAIAVAIDQMTSR